MRFVNGLRAGLSGRRDVLDSSDANSTTPITIISTSFMTSTVDTTATLSVSILDAAPAQAADGAGAFTLVSLGSVVTIDPGSPDTGSAVPSSSITVSDASAVQSTLTDSSVPISTASSSQQISDDATDGAPVTASTSDYVTIASTSTSMIIAGPLQATPRMTPSSTENVQTDSAPATAPSSRVVVVRPGGTSAPQTPTDPASSHGSDIIAPVVATILPLLVIFLCIYLYRKWRRQKKLRKKIRADLEEDAAWSHAQDSHLSQSEDSNETVASDKFCSTPILDERLKSAMKIRPKLQALFLPKHDHSPTSINSVKPSSTLLPDDPFLTPRIQPPFSDGLHSGTSECRSSQIGLAVTTSHNRNESNVSLANSIRTVLHHASRRISNPFGDSSEIVARGDPITPQSESKSQNNDAVATTSSSRDQPLESKVLATTEQQSGGLAKSNTPPEELARRWIEVLKMEAAQAREAADAAARRAAELKSQPGAGEK